MVDIGRLVPTSVGFVSTESRPDGEAVMTVLFSQKFDHSAADRPVRGSVALRHGSATMRFDCETFERAVALAGAMAAAFNAAAEGEPA